jgi:RNase P subunit RPR2
MIYQYNLEGKLLETFSTIAEASAATNIPKSTIWDRANKNTTITGDYIWKSKSMVSENKPKILIFDLESSPMISYHFQMWKVNISLGQVIEKPHLITWAAKWFGDSNIISDKLTTDEALKNDDSRITKSLWELMNEADILVAHYGNGFDIPLANARFAIHGLPPLSPYKSVDTKAVASKHFNLYSNKLDAIAELFGLEGKIQTDFSLWRGCMEGDQRSIDLMETYNKQDVVVLEHVYVKLLPYITNHPNAALYSDSDEKVCTRCGGTHLTLLEKQHKTSVSSFVTYRCDDCGAISRERKTALSKSKRANLLTSVIN